MRSGLAKTCDSYRAVAVSGPRTTALHKWVPEVRLHADQIDVNARKQFGVIAGWHLLCSPREEDRGLGTLRDSDSEHTKSESMPAEIRSQQARDNRRKFPAAPLSRAEYVGSSGLKVQ